MHTHATIIIRAQENAYMLAKAQRLHRPLIFTAVLLWISYVFLFEGIVIGIIVTYFAGIIASVIDSKS